MSCFFKMTLADRDHQLLEEILEGWKEQYQFAAGVAEEVWEEELDKRWAGRGLYRRATVRTSDGMA